MPFTSLGLAPGLLRAVAEEGYEQPTPIQQEAIPLALAGRDLIGSAQTGTGKTAAFMLPILQRLANTGVQHVLRALILVPTRELAAQVLQSARPSGPPRHAGPGDRARDRRRGQGPKARRAGETAARQACRSDPGLYPHEVRRGQARDLLAQRRDPRPRDPRR